MTLVRSFLEILIRGDPFLGWRETIDSLFFLGLAYLLDTSIYRIVVY